METQNQEDIIDAYFRRIGYEGNPSPTLETLQAIHALHPAAIPFENLNPFLRLPVLLDREAIRQKLVDGGRGGYCFEQNLLLMDILRQLGFTVKGLAARVLWNQPEGAVTPRGHMLLHIELDGRVFIADVGFGGLTLTAPLLLETHREQETPHEAFRLIPEKDEFLMQARVRDEWKTLYRFNLQEQLFPDYEVTNWYLSNYPGSHFISGLIAARPFPGGRYALSNNKLALHHLGGGTERRAIQSASELISVLEDIFGLNVSGLPGLDARLNEIIKKESLAIKAG